MTEDVFNQQPDDTTNTQVPEKFFDTLVGEGKKFKDPEELAKGKWESDNYIQTLEKKLDEFRKELDQRETAKEIADRLNAQLANQAPSNEGSHQTPNENGGGNDDLTTQKMEGLSKEELLKLLDERDRMSKAQQNRLEVSRTLSEKVGATAPKWLEDKARELGVTKEYLQQQAEVSPKVFYNLVGLNQSAPKGGTGFVPPQSSFNTQALDSGTQVRNNSYYEKIFKENPKMRFDPKLTVQMHKDAQKMGASFFD
jgi:hypothetical protein